jgi:hypothetical protein
MRGLALYRSVLTLCRIIWVNLLVFLSSSCVSAPTAGVTASATSIRSTPTPQQPISVTSTPSPSPWPTETTTPTPQATATSTPTSVSLVNPIAATISPATLHQLILRKQAAAWIVLDQKYLYWVTYQAPYRILRYPLTGGQTETIAISRYKDGDVTTLTPILSGDWLIFVDTPSASGYATTWSVRALNLRTMKKLVVVEEPGDPISWPGPWVGADGDWVVWTRTGHGKDAQCDQTILAMRNLKTGEQRELEKGCTLDSGMWGLPQLIGDKLIVEQDLPDTQGGGNRIYLFDLTSSQRIPLTEGGIGSMPVAAGSWVIWKDGPRYQYGIVNTVYNLQTGDKYKISAPAKEPSDPEISGHWLYWRPSALEPFYAYDLETNRMLTVATPGGNENLGPAAIYGNTVAWQRDTDFSDAPPTDNVLEWRTLP